MPVTRKPRETQTPQEPLPEDLAYRAYLSKGGSAAQEPQDASQDAAPKDVRFTLHIPGSLCQELDALRGARPLKISRHQWVLEAILEKIQRESGQGA